MAVLTPNPSAKNLIQQQILCDLCAYYPLDEYSGNAIDEASGQLDLTDHGNVGSGPGKVTGFNGIKRARTFNGYDQYFTHAHDDCFSIQQGGGIWGWYELTGTGNAVLACKSNAANTYANVVEWLLTVDYTGPDVAFIIKTTTGAHFVQFVGDVTPGFHFIAAWVDSAASKIYLRLDSTVHSTTYTGTPVSPDSGQDFALANWANAGSGLADPFTGSLDDWGILHCKPSTAALDYLYNNGYGRGVTTLLLLVSQATEVYYSLDEASGDALDATTHDFDLTPSSAIGSVTGLIWTARNITGTNYFSRSNSELIFSIQRGYTIYGWINLHAERTDLEWLFSLAGKASEWSIYVAGFYEAGLQKFAAFGFGSGNTLEVYVPADVWVSTGTWVFVAAWVDLSRTLLGLRINDYTKTAPITSPQATATTTHTFTIGPGDVAQFSGYYDEWGIANRVLTTSELNYLYNSGSGRRVV